MKISRNNDQNQRARKPAPFAKYMEEKLAAAVIIVSLALFALLWCVYVIQRDNSEAYSKIILSQRQSEYVSQNIPYRRGDIYDRNGTKLATSERVYNLILDPKQMRDAEGVTEEGKEPTRIVVNTTIDALSEYFGYDKSELSALISEKAGSAYVKYKKELSYNEKQGFLEYQTQKNKEYSMSDDINERKKQIKGVWFEDEYKRKYPYGSLASSVIGFASADGTSGTGGVEQYYNDTLTGTNGREYGYLNDEANLERVVKSAENGSSLVLTIDANIQNIVEKYLDEWKNGEIGSKSAAAIVMNPKNGEVLAMAGTNSYDLNNPRTTDGYTEEELYELGLKEARDDYKRKNPDAMAITTEQVPEYYDRDQIILFGKMVAWNQLWRNICVSDTFEPGSTQKIFTVGGALEEGIIRTTDTFECKGNVVLSDGIRSWRINCVNRNGHGLLDVTGGITNSCNVVMMNIAFLEKSEIFMKYQRLFGFGDYTGIDLPAEVNAKTLGFESDDIGKTTLATNSFGQNYNCTMIQMAAAYASVINGGYYYEPHVVKQILTADGTTAETKDPVLVRETISQATCDYLKDALFQTVETGTGKAAGVAGYHVGGKTGTAQKLPRSAKTYVVSFCGFAPVEDPQLLCYVVIDEPSLPGQAAAHSSFASEIFSKIMAEALPVMNLYPEGTSAGEYQAPQALLPESEGDAKLPMGSQEETLASTEVPTDENGETLMATTPADGAKSSISTMPQATDEYIEGDDGGGELPDELSTKLIAEGLYEEELPASTESAEESRSAKTESSAAGSPQTADKAADASSAGAQKETQTAARGANAG